MGFRDVVLFYVVTGVSLRWMATAASVGASSVMLWIGAWLLLYLPLALSVIELSSRYPAEGSVQKEPLSSRRIFINCFFVTKNIQAECTFDRSFILLSGADGS